MSTPSLNQIRSKVDAYAAKISAPPGMLPTYGYSQDGAHPHIEVDNSAYHYVIVERGQELKRISTADLDELLYHVFRDVTFSMSTTLEVQSRRPREDFRRQLFAINLNLLGQLEPHWQDRYQHELDKILKEYPFNDEQ